MLGDVHGYGLPPPEREVASTTAESDGETEPVVVGHEDEHQQVGDYELQHVQSRLEGVARAQHAQPHGLLLGVRYGDVVLAGAGVGGVGDALTEEEVPVVLEALVKEGEDDDGHHGA